MHEWMSVAAALAATTGGELQPEQARIATIPEGIELEANPYAIPTATCGPSSTAFGSRAVVARARARVILGAGS